MKGGEAIETADSRQAVADTGFRARVALLAAIGTIAAVRLWFCAELPINTGDLLRSLHTALYVLRDGPSAAGVPLDALDPGLEPLPWSEMPYAYPPLALPFFVLVAAISPTLFAAKLALTLVEAANAMLVARITGSRWLGVIYWGSPASIWWVSREGMFEPWMALFMLGAVATVERRPALALSLLALGVNVKLTAVLLLPWCLVTIHRRDSGAALRSAIAFAVVVAVPVLVASRWYPVIDGLIAIPATVRYNPYYWNPFDRTSFLWNPGWLIAVNAVTSYGVLGLMTHRALVTPDGWHRFGAAIAFVVLMKVSSLAQFWYFLLFPTLLMPARPAGGGVDLRWWLVALAPLLDVRSLAELLVGPFGWMDHGAYEGLSAFSEFGIR